MNLSESAIGDYAGMQKNLMLIAVKLIGLVYCIIILYIDTVIRRKF